jgi:hypothetical protein
LRLDQRDPEPLPVAREGENVDPPVELGHVLLGDRPDVVQVLFGEYDNGADSQLRRQRPQVDTRIGVLEGVQRQQRVGVAGVEPGERFHLLGKPFAERVAVHLDAADDERALVNVREGVPVFLRVAGREDAAVDRVRHVQRLAAFSPQCRLPVPGHGDRDGLRVPEHCDVPDPDRVRIHREPDRAVRLGQLRRALLESERVREDDDQVSLVIVVVGEEDVVPGAVPDARQHIPVAPPEGRTAETVRG